MGKGVFHAVGVTGSRHSRERQGGRAPMENIVLRKKHDIFTIMKNAIKKLKDKGVTLTPQRIAILQLLSKTDEHLTVEEIHHEIKKKYPTMSIATVYSTLELLKEIGEIQELSIMRRGKACFDPHTTPHHHFMCKKCEKIIDIDVECPMCGKELKNGYQVEEMQAYFYGLCPECLKKNKK